MPHYAHSVAGRSTEHWQYLADHLIGVAKLAEFRAQKFAAGKAAYIAGALHDVGKYTDAFQRRLDGGEKVDHASAGAATILSLAGRADLHMAELIAHAIAGHHGGMPDRRGGEHSTLDIRLAKPLPALAEVWRDEVGPLPTGLAPSGFLLHPDSGRYAFQLAMLGRFIFSCLVDADFRDTEDFYARARDETISRAIDIPLTKLKPKLDACLADLRNQETEINRQRGTILDHVRAQAHAAPGLFSLTVPTGGGKTLASLAFALDHAVRHGLDRVIYSIPYTSIIDQTASVFRDILGADAVLEHHSTIDETRMRGLEGAAKLRLAMEDWSAPVVVTTNVQLFEGLFSNRPSRCRKLHNLARSVIVLDEAQTIPRHVLKPCVAAIDELARNYGSSVVLCTATQPALHAPEFEGGFTNVHELAPDPKALQRQFQRVTFRHAGDMSDDDLIGALSKAEEGLIIVNSRKHALALYLAARDAGLDGLVHLTTRMVAAHRREVLERVRTRLKDGRHCRVVATSLVEAGVDLDFPEVWRAEAGLDSILQAAGRCNREGRRAAAESIVTIFRAPDNAPPREVAALAGDFARVADRHDDISGLEAITAYFGEVYWRIGPERLDARQVMAKFLADGSGTDFAYRTVAEEFRLIEEGMAPVIVRRDDRSRKAIEALPHVEKTAASREFCSPISSRCRLGRETISCTTGRSATWLRIASANSSRCWRTAGSTARIPALSGRMLENSGQTTYSCRQ